MQYFGVTGSYTTTAECGNDQAWHSGSTAYVCPGSGNMRVRELSYYTCKSIYQVPSIRVAVYSGTTLVCQGTAAVPVTNIAADWIGHFGEEAITPNPVNLVGGVSYQLAYAGHGAFSNFVRHRTPNQIWQQSLANNTYFSNGLPATIDTAGWTTNAYEQLLRVGVEAIATQYTRSLTIAHSPGISLGLLRKFLKSLPVSTFGTALLGRLSSYRRSLSIPQGSDSSLARKISLIQRITEGSSLLLNWGRVIARNLLATAGTVAVLSRSFTWMRFMPVPAGSAATLSRLMSLTRTLAVASAASAKLTRAIGMTFVTVRASAASLSKRISKTLFMLAGSSAVLGKSYNKVLSVAISPMASLAKAGWRYVAKKWYGVELY